MQNATDALQLGIAHAGGETADQTTVACIAVLVVPLHLLRTAVLLAPHVAVLPQFLPDEEVDFLVVCFFHMVQRYIKKAVPERTAPRLRILRIGFRINLLSGGLLGLLHLLAPLTVEQHRAVLGQGESGDGSLTHFSLAKIRNFYHNCKNMIIKSRPD